MSVSNSNRIDFEDFVAATVSAVARAQAVQEADSAGGATGAALTAGAPSVQFRRPILIGIIFDPTELRATPVEVQSFSEQG
jgi:hypothetical protein